MITLDQYFGKFQNLKTDANIKNATLLLNRVNVLLEESKKYGVSLKINPKTESLISGTQYGGIRPADCPEGSALSSHKKAMGVDIYDPNNALDGWLDDIKLLKYGLYREHPSKTDTWCHITTCAPNSGKRSFYP